MSANFLDGAALYGQWRADIDSGKKPVVYPVAEADNPLNGIEWGPGQVSLFGAPPAAGKTTLVMQLAFDAVKFNPNLKVAVCNVEMSPAKLLDRQLARLAGIPYTAIRKRNLTKEHGEALARGFVDLEQRLKRVAFVKPPYNLINVANTADTFGADLILLDYVQRIGGTKEYADKRLGLNAVMDAVRGFAEAGCAVVVVSAVGRQKNDNGKNSYDDLNLASFRESSELEYGADSAYILIRLNGSEAAVLKCVKNRDGDPQDIPLRFVGDYQRFEPSNIPKEPLTNAVRNLWANDGEGSDW